ncbi:DUF500-domain-containing protein [Venturia nashicola]|uniref:DUF500-domain-containing protein n=1 Tax=Venturia nashicola TaxID=86259 RepID=A0A4Z1PAU0_9PEZI|nr:DUF500-domain-containing protein [Venturia nashicola]
MLGKVKTGGKAGFDKLYGWVDKLGAPVNKLSNKLGAEAFWPTTLDLESEKAARILRSFCKDGFYEEEARQGPITATQRVIKKIPAEVIKNAKGLAIFTTMRTGLWFSGAGGSGILIARLPDGTWSPPSGLMLHTAGLGFLVGVDIYDCVMVINTDAALQAFSKIRATVGGEVSAVAGPIGVGGVLDSEIHKRQAPIFTYLKSRGFYAGVQIDGTVLIERNDENERFYGEKLPVADILAGKVRHPPHELHTLWSTIKAAQGERIAESELPSGQSPSDYEIDDGKLFGVPDKMDPDPYGVLALEKEGYEIRDAGTKTRVSHESFVFSPSPSSPLFAFNRNSIDDTSIRSMSRRSSWRTSTLSNTAQTDRSYTTIDIGIQTDFDSPASSPGGPSSIRKSTMKNIPEHNGEDKQNGMGEEAPKSSFEMPARHKRESLVGNGMPVERNNSVQEARESQEDEELQPSKDMPSSAPYTQEAAIIPTAASPAPIDLESDDEEEEEAVIHTVHQAATPQRAIHARLVSVKKQTPPALPPRNPIRDRKRPLIIRGNNAHDRHEGEESEGQISSAMSRDPSSSSDYKSGTETEEVSSGRSLSSVDLTEEMKHGRPVRPSADEMEARTPSPAKRLCSPSPVLRSREPSLRKSSRSPSPAKKSRTASPDKQQSMPGQF